VLEMQILPLAPTITCYLKKVNKPKHFLFYFIKFSLRSKTGGINGDLGIILKFT
jgi:hypothetical protein